jgi:hypothetical protein
MALMVAGCDTGITDANDVVFPESNVSYGKDVQPLFDLSCTAACHNDVDQAGGISLSSYVALFRVPGLVRPGDSTSSTLWQVVTERLPHQGYPMSRLVNANHQHGIAVWIQEGAHNN